MTRRPRPGGRPGTDSLEALGADVARFEGYIEQLETIHAVVKPLAGGSG
jgi:hypothetical protein